MKLSKNSQAGRKSKADIWIDLRPQKKGAGIKIDLQSSQEKLFGKAIIKSIKDVLSKFDIKDVKITAVDDGALDFVVKARTEAAILEASRGKRNE